MLIYMYCIDRGVAQLVARVVWDHEVAGSIPVTSTKMISTVIVDITVLFYVFFTDNNFELINYKIYKYIK